MRLIWFCASGYSFFLGSIILFLAIFMSLKFNRIWHKLLIYLATLNAVALVFLSATPLNSWFYALWIVSVVIWFFSVVFKKQRENKALKTISFLAICLTVIALSMELPFFFNPVVPVDKFEKLYIIGDSVSDGIGNTKELTWPVLLRKKYSINIVDLAMSGATVKSAMKQVKKVTSEHSLVLLEIGGNDMFAPTPYDLFEKDLANMLNILKNSDNTVVMLELPLLPWRLEYGRIQRKLAKKYEVVLIPKINFVSVLSVPGASVDLAHLSEKGHRLMAEKIAQILPLNFVSQD